MKLCDYATLDVRQFVFFTNSPTPPAGTHIKRLCPHNRTDRLFLNLDAVVMQTHDGGSVTLGDGDVVLIPRNTAYTDDIITEGHALILYLDFSPELPNGIFRWQFAGNPEIKQRFLNVQKLWYQKKTGYYVQCMGEIYSILSMIIRQEKASYTCSLQSAAIEPAIIYMKENFADPDLAIPSLAERCELSYSHFRKLFFDVCGVSANTYLKNLRLDHACQLLTLGDYTIAQSAQMSGFSDVYYFSSFFKHHTGMTPTEYQHRKRRD